MDHCGLGEVGTAEKRRNEEGVEAKPGGTTGGTRKEKLGPPGVSPPCPPGPRLYPLPVPFSYPTLNNSNALPYLAVSIRCNARFAGA